MRSLLLALPSSVPSACKREPGRSFSCSYLLTSRAVLSRPTGLLTDYAEMDSPQFADSSWVLVEQDPPRTDIEMDWNFPSPPKAGNSVSLSPSDPGHSEAPGTWSNNSEQLGSMSSSDRGLRACVALAEYFRGGTPESDVQDTTVFIVCPRSDPKGFRFFLEGKPGATGGRPIFEPQSLAAMGYGASGFLIYHWQLQETINNVFNSLRYFPGKMRLRVHFSDFILGEWKRTNASYSYQELESMVDRAVSRGVAYMDTPIRSQEIVDALRFRLSTVNAVTPLTTSIKAFTDVKPVYSIVLASETLSIESVIESAGGPGEMGSSPSGPVDRYFGPFQVFHRKKGDRKFEIVNLVPIRRHDWMLEFQTFVGQEELRTLVPFTPQSLAQCVDFTGKSLAGNFPEFRLPARFARDHGVEKAFGKISWTYSLNSYYQVEITQLHEWQKDTTAPPTTTTNVTMYATEWDEMMEPANVASGTRQWTDFCQDFLKVDRSAQPWGTPEPWDDFIFWIDMVLKAIEDSEAGEQ